MTTQTKKRLTLGEKIKLLRQRCEMSVSDLEERSGVTRQTIWRIEAGVSRPYWDTVQKMALALGCRFEDLKD